MTRAVPIISALVVAVAVGPLPGLATGVVVHLWSTSIRGVVRSSSPPPPPLRLILILVLVELRSGQSVLGSLQRTAAALPEYRDLRRVARLASVAGLTGALSHTPDQLRPLVSQLARAQTSGASLVGTVRRLLEDDLREERAARLAKVRGLPTRLMLPVALLMMPGVVLLLYGPTVVDLYRGLLTTWP
jgi:hypothetical protein